MQPPLFILPIALFMLIERGRPARLAVNASATILAVLAAGTLAARIVVYMLGADHCGSCRNMMPFVALASQLRAAGYSGCGTILAHGFHIGGNMRIAFPDARIVESVPPPSGRRRAATASACSSGIRKRDPARRERRGTRLRVVLPPRARGASMRRTLKAWPRR